MGDKSLKTAIVTGAASGMGQASAIRMAHEGYHVVAADINTAGLEDTLATIAEAKGSASMQQYDAMDLASCSALVEQTVANHERLDVVVNAAGIAGFYHVHENTNEIFERFITINLTSVMVICREAIPHLKSTGGNIINFSSINGRMPVAYHAAYDASKAGVMALTKSMAQELAIEGVRCNVICPGGFDTPMNENLRYAEGQDMRWLAKLHHPDIPMAEPERIAGVVAFLASKDASYVNGESIIVDGGVGSII